MIGDLHHAEEKPPDNVLFVCKLNPVTTEDDLTVIFSRFGPIKGFILIINYPNSINFTEGRFKGDVFK